MRFDPYQFKHLNISGIPVIMKHIPWADSFVHVQLIFTVGARHDPIGQEGLAHFFEHLPFNGCKGYPHFEDIRRIGRKLFFETLNASTSFEKTSYYGKIHCEHLEQALAFLRALVFTPNLDHHEIERERCVISQEMWTRFNNSRHEQLEKTVRKRIYGPHTFGRSTWAFGWHSSLKRITPDALRSFHMNNYHNGNVRLALAGNIQNKKVKRTIETVFCGIPTGTSLPETQQLASRSGPQQHRLDISSREYFGLTSKNVPKTTEISLFRIAPNMSQATLHDIIETALWNLLFVRVRSALGAVYTPSVGVYRFRDHSRTSICLHVPPTKADLIEKIIHNTIRELAEEDPTITDVIKESIQTCLGRREVVDTTIGKILENAVDEWVSIGSVTPLTQEVRELRTITPSHLSQWFRDQMQPHQLSTVIIRP